MEETTTHLENQLANLEKDKDNMKFEMYEAQRRQIERVSKRFI